MRLCPVLNDRKQKSPPTPLSCWGLWLLVCVSLLPSPCWVSKQSLTLLNPNENPIFLKWGFRDNFLREEEIRSTTKCCDLLPCLSRFKSQHIVSDLTTNDGVVTRNSPMPDDDHVLMAFDQQEFKLLLCCPGTSGVITSQLLPFRQSSCMEQGPTPCLLNKDRVRRGERDKRDKRDDYKEKNTHDA